MNRIICNTIEFIRSDEVESMSGTEVVLREGAAWNRIAATEKPVYGSEITREDGGPVNEETVSVQARYDASCLLRTRAAFYFILRLHTDRESFTVGTAAYPATVEITSDRIFDHLSFTVRSPAL